MFDSTILPARIQFIIDEVVVQLRYAADSYSKEHWEPACKRVSSQVGVSVSLVVDWDNVWGVIPKRPHGNQCFGEALQKCCVEVTEHGRWRLIFHLQDWKQATMDKSILDAGSFPDEAAQRVHDESGVQLLRVHVLAKELNVSSKIIIERLKSEGFESAKNHMSQLSPLQCELLRSWFNPDRTGAENAGPVVVGRPSHPFNEADSHESPMEMPSCGQIGRPRAPGMTTPPIYNEALLVREFEKRERERGPIFAGFIVNDLLPRMGFDAADAKRILRAMEAQNMVRTEQKANPNQPGRTTTYVSLNRAHPHVARVLGGAATNRTFPIARIDGEPLSERIIRDRR